MYLLRALCIYMLSIHFTYAQDEVYKHSLRCDMMQIYEEIPKEVENLSDMFCNGVFYGRIRFNSFSVNWENEVDNRRKDSTIAAVGGSMVYKSAYYKGFSIGVGLYTSYAKGTLSSKQSNLYASGKDTLDLYNLLSGGKRSIFTVAQAYLEYTYKDTYLRVGRQLHESFLTRSNDTKMIPNSFEGLSLATKVLPNTVVKMAYLTKQKLRNHSKFHHLLAYGDEQSDPYARYSQNDDAAIHKGITLSKLKQRDIKDRLFIFEAKNTSFDNLQLYMNYTAAPKLLSYLMLQADYRYDIADWSVTPGFRYMKQFDKGAGSFAGANLKNITTAYRNPDSLDAALYGVRVDIVNDAFKLRFGYTKTADKSDIVTPWRGFPTAGFTRAMSQYNWYANTKSYMVQLDYALETIENFKILARFVVQDFDDRKIGVQADSKLFTFDATKSFPEQSISFKTRFAHVTDDGQNEYNTALSKPNPSYDEVRFEINYLF